MSKRMMSMAVSVPILNNKWCVLFDPVVPVQELISGIFCWSLGKRAFSIFSTSWGSHSEMARKMSRLFLATRSARFG